MRLIRGVFPGSFRMAVRLIGSAHMINTSSVSMLAIIVMPYKYHDNCRGLYILVLHHSITDWERMISLLTFRYMNWIPRNATVGSRSLEYADPCSMKETLHCGRCRIVVIIVSSTYS